MKNIPFFQLFALVSILIFSIQSYRDFMFRGDEPLIQTETVPAASDELLLAQDGSA